MPNYYRTKILTSIKSLDEISLVLKKGVDITANFASKKASDKIQKAGGKLSLVKK